MGTPADSFKERQYEEIEVLKAIFMDDFENRSVDGHNSKSCPTFCLRLSPLQSIVGKDIHAKVQLLVTFTSKYPDDPPVLKLEEGEGLSNEQLQHLQNELAHLADQAVGEVMILQLAQHVQAYLHRYNIPRLSLHEQMVSNNLNREQMLLAEENKRRQHLEAVTKEEDEDVIRQVREEMQRREAAALKSKRQRHLSGSYTNSSRDEDDDLQNPGDEQKTAAGCVPAGLESPWRQSCNKGNQTRKVTSVEFQSKGQTTTVLCGSCQGHCEYSMCCLSGLESATGKAVAIHMWQMPISDPLQGASEHITRQINSVKQEIQFLMSKLQHANLIQYKGITIDCSKDEIVAQVLTDAIPGSSLDAIYGSAIAPLECVAEICRQLVEVLVFIHNKGVVHRDLRPSNIFLDSSGSTVRVAGCSIWRRLSDLFNFVPESEESDVFVFYRKYVQQGKKADVFNLGLILLTLAVGQIEAAFPVDVPESLQAHFRDFLCRCLEADERDRWSASQLQRHEFVRTAVPTQLSTPKKTLTEAPVQVGNHSSIEAQPIPSDLPFSQMPCAAGIPLLNKSRLNNEFEILHWLGEGGFGSVIKVQNKLDGCVYAIKRIPLDPRSPNWTKKITREVKLLSRLNHENVVRYYNSWIEVEDAVRTSDMTPSDSTASDLKPATAVGKGTTARCDLSVSVDEPPSLHESANDADVSWADDGNDPAVPYASGVFQRQHSTDGSGSSSSDGSSSYYSNARSSQPSRGSVGWQEKTDVGDSSEGVIFAMDQSECQFGDAFDTEDESEDEVNCKQSVITTTEGTSGSSNFVSPQFLFIQMEYCEKSTLRNVIDDGLVWDPKRKWRLFREIVEGLAHVHSQGMIHRDLKPVNIFMDSHDHVKIGDFGLATSHTTLKPAELSNLHSALSPDTPGDSNMTGKVGTALYVAPELGRAASRVRFSAKVDVYSLGIILFEMCHRPLTTGMERMKIIGNLRTERIEIPAEFNAKEKSRERYLIRWLLSHDPDARPSARELLDSGYVPPKIEDRQFDELLRHTLLQSNSSKYQRMMTALFSQTVSPAAEVMYDHTRHGNSELAVCQNARALRHVERTMESVFVRHGALAVQTPLLTPKSHSFDRMEHGVTVMDYGGLLLTLPYDSRQNFARLIARNDIIRMRRYCMGRVYRNDRLCEHPKEITECTFDLVGMPTSSMIMEAEVIYVIWEILREFPGLQEEKRFYLRVNHSLLLKAILLHCSIPTDHHDDFIEILRAKKTVDERQLALKRCLRKHNMADAIHARLCTLLEFEGTSQRSKDFLRSLRKTKEAIASLARHSLQELDALIKLLRILDAEIVALISPSLVYPEGQSSGIVFQVVADNFRKRKRGGVDILAMGGRFDLLIKEFARFSERGGTLPCSVGMTLAVDKLVAFVLHTSSECRRDELPRSLNDVDVIVCSLGERSFIEERLTIVRDLWSANIRAVLSSYERDVDVSLEDLQDQCRADGIQHMVLLKETETEMIRIRSQDKEKYVEVRLHRKEICDYLQQRILGKQETKESDTSVSKAQVMPPSNDQGLPMQIAFLPPDKLPNNIRRRMEGKLLSSLSPMVTQIAQKTPLEVLGVDLRRSDVDTIASDINLTTDDEESFLASVDAIMNQLYVIRKYVQRIANALRQMNTRKNVVLLYTYTDDYYRVLL